MKKPIIGLNLGDKRDIILLRNYGPYLDNKPTLPAGEYVGEVFGTTTTYGPRAVSTWVIIYDGHRYSVESEDVNLKG